ncbi:fungal-specific transcription factor domain-containing protein [Cercophora newfieldiana]|uniref:Fungal-specific transcription factor domain-containing protein n=1 Tax=Cercophora newfieldiana TaxID=92897 RepID=A0AA39XXA0_9PEZI|nr:fungal-specific transcription factor domain-containing protein [Cercophora newfieldiana]
MDVDMESTTVPSAPTSAPGSAPPSAPPSAPASASSPATPSEPRRRNRPALSCIQCRTRKIRCDRMEPCASCLKSKIVNCTYEEARRPKPRLWRISPNAADPDSPTSDANFPRFPAGTAFPFRPDAPPTSNAAGLQYANSAAPLPGIGVRSSEAGSVSSSSAHPADGASAGPQTSGSTAALEDRVRQLEQQLADALKRHDAGPQPLAVSQQPYGAQLAGQGVPPAKMPCERGGWMDKHKFFPMIMNIAERLEADTNSKTSFLLLKCKDLGKSIRLRTQRALLHSPFDIGSSALPEATVRLLVEAYFRTFESVYRILHRPTFWREYRQYWDGPPGSSEAFVMQLKLCIVIGACFHDNLAAHRRSLAAKWIHEVKLWLVSHEETVFMSFEGLQVMCLLHIARETCGVGDDLGWVSAGSILRIAMQMGLHRDPDPDGVSKMPTLHAEMRRRLWATVLEMILQSSMDSGGPPLVTASDFDTRQPSNFDDDQLTENEQQPPVPRPLSSFTQTTVQLALLRSFPTRLAIAQYVSDINTAASYEVTLKWNSELTNACRALSATLQPSYDPAGILPKRLSLFQLRLAEHMVHRFFLALNHPWLAQDNPAYYFARKMCVETALKLYRAIAAGSPAGDSGTASQTDDFTRLATCGHGAFRSVPMLAVLSISLELLWQVQEDQSFRQSMDIDQIERVGPGGENDVGTPALIGSGAAPRQDLFDAVKYAITWTTRRIIAGETNLKGRLFYSALLTQVQGLQRGATDAEVERMVLNSLDDDLEHCWHILNDIEASTPGTSTGRDSAESGERDRDESRHKQGLRSIFNSNDVESLLHG